MFNKPSVFGRNEPANRRAAAPVVDAQPASAAPRSAAPVRPASVAPAIAALPPADVAPAPLAEPSGDAANGGQLSGARLIVGPEVKLKGAEILDCDTLVVEGRVEATMDSRLLRIAANGAFVGKVSIDVAEIDGVFEGELTARSQLMIRSTGRVSGTIRFGKLVVEKGGELNGEISVLGGVAAASPKAAPASSGVVIEPFVALGAAKA
jgi:cytoskeletal protein CcmA (bactofilin family)